MPAPEPWWLAEMADVRKGKPGNGAAHPEQPEKKKSTRKKANVASTPR
jgi:hypothetical protein